MQPTTQSTITISCLAFSTEPIKKLAEEAQRKFAEEQSDNTYIYVPAPPTYR